VTTATPDDSGAFTVDLAPGTYTVRVDEFGLSAFETQTTVTENETASVAVDLQSMGSVAGFVTNTRDDPLGGVVVECVDPDTGETVQTATTGENGQYTVELPTDTYEMHVDEDGFAPVTETMTVEAGITTQADIDLHLPPVVGDRPPRDLDGDGLYRNVRGDGNFRILDVQALFNNLDSDAVQNHADAYNFYGDDTSEVTILDVQALFNDLQDSDELDTG